MALKQQSNIEHFRSDSFSLTPWSHRLKFIHLLILLHAILIFVHVLKMEHKFARCWWFTSMHIKIMINTFWVKYFWLTINKQTSKVSETRVSEVNQTHCNDSSDRVIPLHFLKQILLDCCQHLLHYSLIVLPPVHRAHEVWVQSSHWSGNKIYSACVLGDRRFVVLSSISSLLFIKGIFSNRIVHTPYTLAHILVGWKRSVVHTKLSTNKPWSPCIKIPVVLHWPITYSMTTLLSNMGVWAIWPMWKLEVHLMPASSLAIYTATCNLRMLWGFPSAHFFIIMLAAIVGLTNVLIIHTHGGIFDTCIYIGQITFGQHTLKNQRVWFIRCQIPLNISIGDLSHKQTKMFVVNWNSLFFSWFFFNKLNSQ